MTDISLEQTIKLQYKFNQELFWLLLHLNSLQPLEEQEQLSKKISKLVDIQTELRKAIHNSLDGSVKNEMDEEDSQ